MSAVNWDVFLRLPGAAEANFEKLCRTLIRRHYGQFGDFRQLANQAGVEFHLQLRTPCDLGAPPRWFGWQCKWYGLKNGQKLGKTRRDDIIDSLEKSCKYLPGLTDWVLWTRLTLAKEDQEWFYGLKSRFPKLALGLKTADDVEALLTGAAVSLRDTYFGDLVVTPEVLQGQYHLAAAPFRHRYQQEVHQVTPAEQELLRSLLDKAAWSSLSELADRLTAGANSIAAEVDASQPNLRNPLREFIAGGLAAANYLRSLLLGINAGDLAAINELLLEGIASPYRYRKVVARLRSARSIAALDGANLLADIYASMLEVDELRRLIELRAVAILAPAGGGKSELALRISSPSTKAPGGVLFFGSSLSATQDLDGLVRGFKALGRSASDFESFLEAINAAGERTGNRVAVVIDGLNESEDPRKWKNSLSKASEHLKDFPYVLLIVTLRAEFAEDCLPGELVTIELNGFEDDPKAAVDKYFAYYKIDATDEDLPLELLQHPLTLRIYCEVANSDRRHHVGVEKLPRSLNGLFAEHFKQVSIRIADRSPIGRRIYPEEVQAALRGLGEVLWVHDARAIEQEFARRHIRDTATWDHSLIRQFESEGVLVRVSDGKGRVGLAFTYDLMAGHILAGYLLYQHDMAQWLSDPVNSAKFDRSSGESHPFAQDAFQALVDLYPDRSRGGQLWKCLEGGLRSKALLLTAKSDPALINRETVEQFAREVIKSTTFAKAAFPLLRITRAAQAHPFDAEFLDSTLRAMTNTERDLSWSEWLRQSEDACLNDIRALEARWADLSNADARDVSRARWAIWMLTTNVRYLRDLTTKALHAFALRSPGRYYELACGSLSISDPYVPERAFAAAYGAALATWSNSSARSIQELLPSVASNVVDLCFVPGAPFSTRHTLLRQYLLGIIDLGRKIEASCIQDKAKYLEPPFAHLPSPFNGGSQWTQAQLDEADDAAIRMDFGNYTIGRLIPDRSNYDFHDPDYVSVRKAIVARLLDLGYSPEKFADVEKKIGSVRRYDREDDKTDRYGKKYAWIAYFEMWGVRSDLGRLPEWRNGDRTPDVDIDPSFPGSIKAWSPTLPDLFDEGPQEIKSWILEGPTPDYSSLLSPRVVDGCEAGWVLMDGFVAETAKNDYRHIFTFLRGLFVPKRQLAHLTQIFGALSYPGNDEIPSPSERHYTFAGEMPLDRIPGLRFPSDESNAIQYQETRLGRRSQSGVRVEIPVNAYRWESYHSKVNTDSGALFPTARICQNLGLGFRPNQWDLEDDRGLASLFRTLSHDQASLKGNVAYLRADLLNRYLKETRQILVWLIWGEREEHYRSNSRVWDTMQGAYGEYRHIHKRLVVWEPTKFKSNKRSQREH